MGTENKKMDLQDYRKQIDVIDTGLTELLMKRLSVVENIADYKIENNKQVLDAEREAQKLTALQASVETTFEKEALRELFSQIMAISRKRQYKILEEKGTKYHQAFMEVDALRVENGRIVYQGTEGSYSEMAMHKYFGKDIDAFAVDTFEDAMRIIEEGSADYAVLPIENSTAGFVSENYDLLSKFENYIVGDVVLPIRHALMAVNGATIADIKKVYAHPQALMQTERFLNRHPDWDLISMKNNAFAARKVAEDKDITHAAIAGEGAAERYGLTILEHGINQDEKNSTRFIIVTNRKIFLKDAKIISLCLEATHESGSLYRLLSHIIYNGLNMTKIESRPIEERNFEYRFFIDFEGNLNDPAVRNALRGMREEARSLKVLGNY